MHVKLPYTPQQVLEEFNYQLRHWRLEELLQHLFAGQHHAKCQFGWYLQYMVSPQEMENFLHTFAELEQAEPDNPYIPFIKMIQNLYGLGVTPSLEQSRYYLQQFQERYAFTTTDPHDIFLQTLIEIQPLAYHLRCQWLASKGNGDALCDLVKYYLTETKDSTEIATAIELLTAAGEFGHYRALKELAALYREGMLVPMDENKANHFSRKAFLRKISLQTDKLWQIKELPIAGYTERLIDRSTARVYHETLCMIQPEYDFLFDKHSTLVPLVHNPSSAGVLENVKIILPYFIEQIIAYDKEELKSARLQAALEKLIAEQQPAKTQRDQIHLFLAYQYALENNLMAAATHALAVKQPHAYCEMIQQLDPAGHLGAALLLFAEQLEKNTQEESDSLTEYALIYLIANLDTLSPAVHKLLKIQLLEKFPQNNINDDTLTSADLKLLANWHMQYSQTRYALYKIDHRLKNYSRLKWYFSGKHRLRYQNAQAAWHEVLQQLNTQAALSQESLDTIQDAYPILTNALNELRIAPTSVLKRVAAISATLLKNAVLKQ